MFGRKKEGDVDKAQSEFGPEEMVAQVKAGARPGATMGGGMGAPTPQLSANASTPQRPPAMPARPMLPETASTAPQGLRIPPEQPRGTSFPAGSGAGAGPGGSAPPAASAAPAARPESELRQLIVGRDISLAGEINSCDRLIVEGSVDTHLSGCQDITITETGLFKGSATIDEAEIRGRFEGTLSVNKRLLICSTGTVTGTVRYGQIEIECGGRIIGDIQVMSEPGRANATAAHDAILETRRERSTQPVVEIGAGQPV